jgi:inosine-uridine nucleoside N-ribohydrolase
VRFHDPLAAGVVFEPDLCTYEAGVVLTDVTRPGDEAARTFFTAAKTLPDAPRAFTQRVARGVKARAFFDHYFAVVSDRVVTAPGRFLPPPQSL